MEHMPLIGISGSMEEDKVFLLQAYFDAITAAGGIPLLLNPYMRGAAVSQLMNTLDGLMLAGGGDMEPKHFGQEPVKELGETTPVRDMLELELLEAAERLSPMPVLGICRGMQVMNVAAGGSLFQDLPTQHPKQENGLLTHLQTQPYEQPTHAVLLRKESLLCELAGQECCMVNSMHHQAVDRIGTGYDVIAAGEDGVVEAIQHTKYPFRLAVQWHPERLQDSLSKGLFAAFVRSATVYKRSKP